MDDAYLLLKYAHVISSTLLFGTGLGTAFHGWMAHRSGDRPAIAVVSRNVVLADWIFTAPAVVVQPATGLALAHLAGFPWHSPWLLASVVLYLLVGACWLPVVWLQIRMHRMAGEATRAGAPAAGAVPPLRPPLVRARLAGVPRRARDLLVDDRQAGPVVTRGSVMHIAALGGGRAACNGRAVHFQAPVQARGGYGQAAADGRLGVAAKTDVGASAGTVRKS